MKRQNLHYRELPSVVYHEQRLTPRFRKFFDAAIRPHLILSGYKLADKLETAVHVVNLLIKTGVCGRCVADTRDWHQPGARFRAELWDAVVAAGFATVCLGSQVSGMLTRYRATSKLLDLEKLWKGSGMMEDTELARNTETIIPTTRALVVLQAGKLDATTGNVRQKDRRKAPLDWRKYITWQFNAALVPLEERPTMDEALSYWRAHEDWLDAFNQMTLNHAWKALGPPDPATGKRHAFQPIVCVRQVHSQHAWRATRLYTFGEWGGQNLNEEIRQTITIDREPAAELDFASMSIRMMYQWGRKNWTRADHPDADADGDLYRPELVFPKFYSLSNASAAKKALLRDFVKKATNICINVSSRGRANSAAGKLLAEHDHATALRKVLKLEGLTVKGVIDRVVEAHPLVSERFFAEVGLELMTMDGRIMYHMLGDFTERDVPVLPIHDAVVCRVSDVAFVEKVMRQNYFKFLQHEPVIRRVF